MELKDTLHFELDRGFVDDHGTVHRQGRLRLATARDVMVCRREPRVQDEPEFLPLLILSRVVVQLGGLEGEAITPEVIRELTSADYEHLKQLYKQLNEV